MCRRWNSLLATSCRARRVLILDDGTWSIDLIQFTIDLPFERLVGKKEFLHRFSKGHPGVLDLKKGALASEASSLPFHSLAGHLVSLFSNIRHLYISMHTSTETLALAVPLINAWATQLTTVHLLYKCVAGQLEPTTRKEAAHTLTSLLDGINSCTSLKRLHFNVELNAGTAADATASPIQLRLPGFSRVSCLFFNSANFSSPSDVNLPLHELRQHVQADNGSLRRVALKNRVTLSELTQIEPHLARRFVRLKLLDEITLSTLPKLAHLCSRFTSLGSLSLSFSVPMCRLVSALAPLTILEHLSLTYKTLDLEGAADGAQQQGPSVKPLPSVKYLALRYGLPSHEQLTRLSLVDHFPSVEHAITQPDK